MRSPNSEDPTDPGNVKECWLADMHRAGGASRLSLSDSAEPSIHVNLLTLSSGGLRSPPRRRPAGDAVAEALAFLDLDGEAARGLQYCSALEC